MHSHIQNIRSVKSDRVKTTQNKTSLLKVDFMVGSFQACFLVNVQNLASQIHVMCYLNRVQLSNLRVYRPLRWNAPLFALFLYRDLFYSPQPPRRHMSWTTELMNVSGHTAPALLTRFFLSFSFFSGGVKALCFCF